MKLNFICTNHPDIDKVIKYNQRELEPGVEDWRHFAGGIYLDGKVETANQYDCVDLIDYDGLETIDQADFFENKVRRVVIPDGIYDCTVYGYDHPCRAYIWHRYVGEYFEQRGLIVDITDTKNLESAQQKYNVRSYSL